MTPIDFVFAVHNHQPVGNFDSVFEEAFAKAYKPFLDVLEKHPSVRLTQHWSGPLLEWLVQRHPEVIGQMKEMIRRGQLELLTGAFYEAILPVIPEDDRVGQILKLTEFLNRTFDVQPRGMWLAERVWEPQLAGTLARADVEYVMVDDSHFLHAGFARGELHGYYVTEELGEVVNVIPMDKQMRYAVPFHTVAQTAQYLKDLARDFPGQSVVHADDGEKFGVWPRTFAHVYTDGWLEQFCTALEEAPEAVRVVRACDLVDTHTPAGRAYLPTDSYAEMTRWALPAQAQVNLERFEKSLQSAGLLEGNEHQVRGGFWRNFLARYPEANQMHKKMLRVAGRIQHAAREHKIPREVYDHLWAGQCNDAYWHGLFGGLYLPSLRFSLFRHLITAERLLESLTGNVHTIIEEGDCDGDGESEVLIESNVMDCCFKPSLGGCLVELDYKPGDVNLLDILSRREEGNHRRLQAALQTRQQAGEWDELLAKEPDLQSRLVFDWYRHASFLDHIFEQGTTLDAFSRQTYTELGDFVNQPYGSTVITEGDQLFVRFVRDGGIWRGGRKHALRIQKMFHFEMAESRITTEYTVENLEESDIEFMFGIELAAGGMAGSASDRYYLVNGERPADSMLQSTGTDSGVRTFGLADEWMGVKVQYDLGHPAMLWRFPLETVSLSEAGFERLYQGSIMLPHWHVALGPAPAGHAPVEQPHGGEPSPGPLEEGRPSGKLRVVAQGSSRSPVWRTTVVLSLEHR